MTKRFFIGILIAISFIVLFFHKESVIAPVVEISKQIVDSEYKTSAVKVGKESFSALIADTEALRSKGLSGRTSLGLNQAMLFVFDSPDVLGFWMKDMLFSIDILWLDSQSRVVSFEKNVSPSTYPKIFFPTSSALYVIEFSAGTLDKVGVSKEDYVQIGL